MFRNFIQAAGIIDFEEAKMLMDCGVNFLGFPLRLPVNKEDLPEEAAAKIILQIHEPFHAVLITYLHQADEIIEFCKHLNVKIVQLHGDISMNELKKLRVKSPEISVIKSLVIGEQTNEILMKKLESFIPFVDAFITDTYNAETGARGATGLTHDWNISKKICKLSPKPVILAGGLNPKNIYEAIKFVKPSGVDSHTGIEDMSGRKSEELVRKFVSEAKKAFPELNYVK